MNKQCTSHFEVLDEVRHAVANNIPVVALESTIISHGMPYPQNLEMAREVGRIIRSYGVVPATTAVINGVMKVGITEEEMEFLAKECHQVKKISRRDLPFVIAEGLHGATTVASAMIMAEMAGVKVFATGGIGGVHRGAETNFDISADLDELAITDVAVVCAGAKSILDLGLTLEYLETKGVPVIGYQTDTLPAFFTRNSAFPIPFRLDSANEIAKVMQAKWQAKLKGGMVIANPIPEAYAMSETVINKAIEQAIHEAEEKGITGKESTPYLLDRVKQLTGGDSLNSNIQLVYNNAKLAAEIAIAYQKIN